MLDSKGALAKLKEDLRMFDEAIDKGNNLVEIVHKRLETLNKIQQVNNTHMSEVAQKAKINWDVEGDENTKFFMRDDLKRKVMKEEVKKAVWDCGSDKSPGLDGFLFSFFRHFWSTIEKDIFKAVDCFFMNEDMPNGCNSNFIALISKIIDANMVKDFRPIRLIGSLYKVIAKILTNRLVNVIGDLVNEVPSACVADRQILDGPFILNAVIQWCRKKKKHTLIFKVDFEKTYDSSKIMGVNVEDGKIQNAAHKLGCLVLETPFTYLGTKVGENMSRKEAWKDVVDKVLSCLSKWKTKSLSIGGRFTLLKSVLGSMPIFYMSIFKVPSYVLKTLESICSRFFNVQDHKSRKASWVKWDNVLTSRDKGGLGVASLYTLNR
nr:RNA-directed DNA polymerase, eukaryota, reverse transcriptase zinc-binding domain protein [Tanacetum cinerariifolium]GFB40007.1 RNA-directed DNA polymerase, eukaryota, reverse transcriptase zinc-binding domain protein [Tanacetum cinerariifolium]